jgi:hypothetical protein
MLGAWRVLRALFRVKMFRRESEWISTFRRNGEPRDAGVVAVAYCSCGAAPALIYCRPGGSVGEVVAGVLAATSGGCAYDILTRDCPVGGSCGRLRRARGRRCLWRAGLRGRCARTAPTAGSIDRGRAEAAPACSAIARAREAAGHWLCPARRLCTAPSGGYCPEL